MGQLGNTKAGGPGKASLRDPRPLSRWAPLWPPGRSWTLRAQLVPPICPSLLPRRVGQAAAGPVVKAALGPSAWDWFISLENDGERTSAL